jgi:glucuronate isomerase
MKPFMDADFLLTTPEASRLYHTYAEKLPIIDYHCHLDPKAIAENRRYRNIAQAWLGGDHYKWRLMRAAGIDEAYITGNAPDSDKFMRFAEILPMAAGNPVHHWCHMELRAYFGWCGVLNGDTAEEVWRHTSEVLSHTDVRSWMAQSGVEIVCTTDDPADDLIWHRKTANDPSCAAKVYPSFRPDKAIQPGFWDDTEYVSKLGVSAGIDIMAVDDLKAALIRRMDAFAQAGCRISDHALPDAETEGFRFEMLRFLAAEYARRGWAMQLHFAAQRNVNPGMLAKLGPDTGFDAIGNGVSAQNLGKLLASFEPMPKIILYSLNPNDNAVLATVAGCFPEGCIQHGSAWWFNDTKDGMEAQLRNLANGSLLGNFVGMLTDSRSFLSFPRHDYFRRILCNLIGGWVKNGEYPPDEAALERLLTGICYRNTKTYFGF